jgi:hypothetical protein
MSKKTDKDKKPRPLPRQNQQIPNSLIRKATALGVSLPLQNAREYPIYGCWIMAGWKEAGITPVVVAREQEPGRVMIGVYMVDLFCLGVKDVFTRTDYTLSRFERDLPELCSGAPQKCSVELAHEVIYGALEYAEKIGFQPHSDFKRQMADLLLDPPDAHPRVDHVRFGKDGQPFFVAGPYDDKYKISKVINTLRRTCGEGNYQVLAGMDGLFG